MTDQNHDFDQVDFDQADAGRIAEKIAAVGDIDALKDSGAFDKLMGQIDAGELKLDGKDGFSQQLIKASLERGLSAEMTDHLGYEK